MPTTMTSIGKLLGDLPPKMNTVSIVSSASSIQYQVIDLLFKSTADASPILHIQLYSFAGMGTQH